MFYCLIFVRASARVLEARLCGDFGIIGVFVRVNISFCSQQSSIRDTLLTALKQPTHYILIKTIILGEDISYIRMLVAIFLDNGQHNRLY